MPAPISGVGIFTFMLNKDSVSAKTIQAAGRVTRAGPAAPAQGKYSHVQEHRVHDFNLAEPFFVTVTACGYLSTESVRLGLDHGPEIAKILEARKRQFESGYTSDLGQFRALYVRVKELGIELASAAKRTEGPEATDWEINGRLLAMYQRGLITDQ